MTAVFMAARFYIRDCQPFPVEELDFSDIVIISLQNFQIVVLLEVASAQFAICQTRNGKAAYPSLRSSCITELPSGWCQAGERRLNYAGWWAKYFHGA